MIISRTPFRISFFGGGTDYPPWFQEHGGAVVGMAINKYCYISVRHLPPFFQHRSRIVYSNVELVKEVGEIQHPAVRGVLSHLGINDGLEVHHDADLPARSGLGSSSSFTVGLINALHALNSRMVSKSDLAKAAIHVEQNVLKENVGCQDQIWAAHGGFNRITFSPDGSFAVEPLIVHRERCEELLQSVMLVFTGFSRYASEVAGEKIKNLAQKQQQLRTMRELVDAAIDVVVNERAPLREIGKMLHESWLLKRELAGCVSNGKIDEIYEAARSAGAIGGKLLGAGGGGFMVFFVEPGHRARVRERLKDLIHVSVGVDREGSKIVLFQPNGL